MIARLLFPPLASCLPNPPQVLVPHQGRGSTVPMLPDTGILSRWNCYPPDTSGSAALIYLPFVVGPITTHLLHRLGALVQKLGHRSRIVQAGLTQHHGLDFLGFTVHAQMELPPGAPFGIAMLTHLPFSLPKDFQPGAVQDQMQGPSSPCPRKPPGAWRACRGWYSPAPATPTPASETRTGETLR